MKTRILCVLGTRPEAIKMAPVILALRKQAWAAVTVVATAQHRDMLDQALDIFGITPDVDLDIMQPDQNLAELSARLLLGLDHVLESVRPDAVLVQGDTTSAMATSLTAFYRQIPVGHIEAGLRTWDMRSPFPEEANRVITGKLARWHFAPTENARQNLVREGVIDAHIVISGNTVIDALLITASRNIGLDAELRANGRMVLVTIHRRENFGEPFAEICRAIGELASRNPGVNFLYPVHPNPRIRSLAHERLYRCANVRLCEPLSYPQFVAAMKTAYFILTDSGGVQEEAPALGKPVLVLREKTERPEAVERGQVRLVGRDYARIVQETQRLLDDESAHAAMVSDTSPYGDGHASERIVDTLRRHFS